MPTLQIISAEPLAGKSTVAAALARGFADAGLGVRLVRVGNDDRARRDAEVFAELPFATAAAAPVAASRVPASRDGVTIAEVDGAAPLSVPAVVVVRASVTDADRTLARSLGERLVGTIATLVAVDATEDVARDLTNSDMRPLALLPEDETLAAPAVGEIRDALGASVLHDGENARTTVEHVLVAPIYTDGARNHFHRFASKAILTPYNKTDLLLAAIEAGAACVVVTGGHAPSPYVIDRVRDEETTILLSDQRTVPTVTALSEVWTHSPFRGVGKAEAAYALLRDRLDFASLQRKLEA